MTDAIKCPQCRTEIPLSEVISHQIEERLAAELAQKMAQREQKLREAFEKDRERHEQQVRAQAQEQVATELADLRGRTESQEQELRDARTRELAFLQEKRKLAEERENLDLEVARRMDDERRQVAAEVRQKAAEQHTLELRQKELQIEQMQRQIVDLKESSEQARAGLIGEAQEREIEDVLIERFRHDRIEPIKAGVRGADVLQTVVSRRGESCGKILWESKRARNWSSAWIPKLKEDQAAAGADVAVLVSSVLPAGVRHMELVDGVWVTSFACVVAMAGSLREGLIGMAQARSIDANRNESLGLLYDYLTSNEFNRRIRAIVEAFVHMKEDLESEKRAMERIWTKRGKQIDAVSLNTAGMYGDLEAIVGAALPAVETLELPAPVPTPVPIRAAIPEPDAVPIRAASPEPEALFG